jgi:ElaB/YqjD/DUF883 family membrane-anchored ribosome-binding protein
MARVNLNTHDLITLIDSLNDSLLRSTSFTKVRQLESLKARLVRALDGHDKENNKEEQDVIKSSKRSKRSRPQM